MAHPMDGGTLAVSPSQSQEWDQDCARLMSREQTGVDPKVGSMITEHLSTKCNIGSMIQSDPMEFHS